MEASEGLIKDICQYFGLPPAINGKLEYVDQYASHWVFEINEEVEVFSVHSVLNVQEEREDIFQKLMVLNESYELSAGAVFSYNLENNVFHIRFSAPLFMSDFVVAKNIIENLIEIKHAVENEL